MTTPASMELPPPPPPFPLLYLKEEEGETQDFQDFLSTLPREKGWVATHLYQHQGFWHNPRHLQGVLKCQTQFKAHPTDLFLVTTPKSGTTWLKSMAFAIINRVRHSPSNHPLLTKNPHELVPFLELRYVDNQVPDFTGFESPRLFATHLPWMSLPESVMSSESKIVYLCRNPKDTLVSCWFFANKLRPKHLEPNALEDVFERFCNGVSLFGPFWDHVLEYWKQSLEKPQRVCFMKFEDMKMEPKVHLRNLAEFLDFPFSADEENEGVMDGILKLCSFDSLSNLEVNKNGKLVTGEENNAFFRRGEVGDWMNHLTPEMIDRLDQITEEKFLGFGLKF